MKYDVAIFGGHRITQFYKALEVPGTYFGSRNLYFMNVCDPAPTQNLYT